MYFGDDTMSLAQLRRIVKTFTKHGPQIRGIDEELQTAVDAAIEDGRP
jgi:hypothetical protein